MAPGICPHNCNVSHRNWVCRRSWMYPTTACPMVHWPSLPNLPERRRSRYPAFCDQHGFSPGFAMTARSPLASRQRRRDACVCERAHHSSDASGDCTCGRCAVHGDAAQQGLAGKHRSTEQHDVHVLLREGFVAVVERVHGDHVVAVEEGRFVWHATENGRAHFFRRSVRHTTEGASRRAHNSPSARRRICGLGHTRA